MNCLEFERLLDEGEPARLSPAARSHARECARCERSLARARSLEHALTRHFATALELDESVPKDFADRVITRVQRGEARGVRWLALPDALPWWVRVPAEPTVALAAAVAALLLWRGDVLVATARAWVPGVALAPVLLAERMSAAGWWGALSHALATTFLPGPGSHWTVITAMAIAIAPVLALAGFALWRLGERLVGEPGVAALR